MGIDSMASDALARKSSSNSASKWGFALAVFSSGINRDELPAYALRSIAHGVTGAMNAMEFYWRGYYP